MNVNVTTLRTCIGNISDAADDDRPSVEELVSVGGELHHEDSKGLRDFAPD